MTKIILDKDLARAIAWDAADRNMRKDGRKTWDENDSNVAAITFNQLMDKIEGKQIGA